MCNREYQEYSYHFTPCPDVDEGAELLREELQAEHESDMREQAREREWSDDDVDTRREEADFREHQWGNYD